MDDHHIDQVSNIGCANGAEGADIRIDAATLIYYAWRAYETFGM